MNITSKNISVGLKKSSIKYISTDIQANIVSIDDDREEFHFFKTVAWNLVCLFHLQLDNNLLIIALQRGQAFNVVINARCSQYFAMEMFSPNQSNLDVMVNKVTEFENIFLNNVEKAFL